jgi:hypothetical protein
VLIPVEVVTCTEQNTCYMITLVQFLLILARRMCSVLMFCLCMYVQALSGGTMPVSAVLGSHEV